MPTNGTDMRYNLTKHLYVLELGYVKKELGLDFVEKEGSETKAKDKMYQISRTIYNYIYKHTHYRNQMEYWLATDSDIRPMILQALEEQARYEYEMDAEFLSKQSGVNVVNGIQIPLARFRGDMRISPDAVDYLRDKKLLYMGQRFFTNSEHDYTEDGY